MKKTLIISGVVIALAIGGYFAYKKFGKGNDKPMPREDADKLLKAFNESMATELMAIASGKKIMSTESKKEREKIKQQLLMGGWDLIKPTEAGKGYTISAYTKEGK